MLGVPRKARLANAAPRGCEGLAQKMSARYGFAGLHRFATDSPGHHSPHKSGLAYHWPKLLPSIPRPIYLEGIGYAWYITAGYSWAPISSPIYIVLYYAIPQPIPYIFLSIPFLYPIPYILFPIYSLPYRWESTIPIYLPFLSFLLPFLPYIIEYLLYTSL